MSDLRTLSANNGIHYFIASRVDREPRPLNRQVRYTWKGVTCWSDHPLHDARATDPSLPPQPVQLQQTLHKRDKSGD